MTVAGICELVLETDEVGRLRSFREALSGDRSAYFFGPAGNRVEPQDFLRDGDGAEAGVTAPVDGHGS